MKTEHTATPWKLDQYGNVKAGKRDNVLVTGFSLNTGFSDETAEANTDFIVRACNAHDDLVKALQIACYKLNYLHTHYTGNEAAEIYAIEKQARAALSKARA